MAPRVLVVANRLPFSAVRTGEASWSLNRSPGGLVSALAGVKDFEAVWIGWPGVAVCDESGQKALTKALAEKNSIPVFLSEDIIKKYYDGYSNSVLWPLLHYLDLPQHYSVEDVYDFENQFATYKKANETFAEVVSMHRKSDDLIWIHDYHLMMLPQLLRKQANHLKIGLFLHTPFPCQEKFTELPQCNELLTAVLEADLLGFHTKGYAQHFVRACTEGISGYKATLDGVTDKKGRLTRITSIPIGIDVERYMGAAQDPEVQQHIQGFSDAFSGQKVLLGVDCFDMTKGIPQKFLAFERFLKQNPSWLDKVVLVQIAVPTRTNVPEYQELTSYVHSIVTHINSKFGSIDRSPVKHLDQSMDFNKLCALYAVADVALVTSVKDGMNLVSYEFMACQAAKKGGLILSEFTGVSEYFRDGTMKVNPYDISEVAAKIAEALTMDDEKRESMHRRNFTHVTTNTSQKWAERFLGELKNTVPKAQL